MPHPVFAAGKTALISGAASGVGYGKSHILFAVITLQQYNVTTCSKTIYTILPLSDPATPMIVTPIIFRTHHIL